MRTKSLIRRREREKSSVRAKGRACFWNRQWAVRYRKTRYKGRRKQVARLNILFALANLYLPDKRGLLA